MTHIEKLEDEIVRNGMTFIKMTEEVEKLTAENALLVKIAEASEMCVALWFENKEHLRAEEQNLCQALSSWRKWKGEK